MGTVPRVYYIGRTISTNERWFCDYKRKPHLECSGEANRGRPDALPVLNCRPNWERPPCTGNCYPSRKKTGFPSPQPCNSPANERQPRLSQWKASIYCSVPGTCPEFCHRLLPGIAFLCSTWINPLLLVKYIYNFLPSSFYHLILPLKIFIFYHYRFWIIGFWLAVSCFSLFTLLSKEFIKCVSKSDTWKGFFKKMKLFPRVNEAQFSGTELPQNEYIISHRWPPFHRGKASRPH